MGTEMISKLLEKLDKQQYTDVIRSFSQHNKRLKIPGFTLVERAPLKLVANTARTNKLFRNLSAFNECRKTVIQKKKELKNYGYCL